MEASLHGRTSFMGAEATRSRGNNPAVQKVRVTRHFPAKGVKPIRSFGERVERKAMKVAKDNKRLERKLAALQGEPPMSSSSSSSSTTSSTLESSENVLQLLAVWEGPGQDYLRLIVHAPNP